MSGKVAEVYTFPPDAQTPAAIEARQKCLCRFRGQSLECEQKNNRGQVAVLKLSNYPHLQKKYGRSDIPLGICSIFSGGRPWIVCPNRLFYTGEARPVLEHWIYHHWGLKAGDTVALWREVGIQSKKRSKEFNYHFDYVFRKVLNAEARVYDDKPYVVEVMSCSTSGGGVSQQFAGALEPRESGERARNLSLNKRQVLGRMMSQLVAKAEVVHNWGGKTAWIVQDVFWNYMNKTTGFNMDEFHNEEGGNMLVVVRHLETAGYNPNDPGCDAYELRLERILQGWDRFDRRSGESMVGRDFVSLLNAPFTPDRQLILDKTSQRLPTAIVSCVD